MQLPDLANVLFWIVAPLTCLAALGVVVAQNVVRMAVWLLLALAGTAALFFLLAADFVAATQLIVYVGGTLVLVVFGVMLTAQGPFISMKTNAAQWAIATVVGLLFLGVLITSIHSANLPKDAVTRSSPADSPSGTQLGEAFLGIADATPQAQLAGLPPGAMAPRKRMSYLLPFEIVSVHLLVVLIGAAYLARAKRRRGAVAS